MAEPDAEFELIARILERLAASPSGRSGRLIRGSGDDAAVTVPGAATATSIDAVIEGVHFDLTTASMADVGHKALAVALSDLAAMGAEPGEAYVALGLPQRLAAGALELCDGLIALAESTGTALAGGNVAAAGELSVTVSVVGHAPSPDQLIGRDGGRMGSLLAVSGSLGGAAGGLEALRAGRGRSHPALVDRHLHPLPLLDCGRALARCGAEAMIDLSDGLIGDAAHLAAASEVGVEIDAAAVPIDPALTAAQAELGIDPLELALGGGEDYELLVALPAEAVDHATTLLGDLGARLTVIGRLVPGAGVNVPALKRSGKVRYSYQHLRTDP